MRATEGLSTLARLVITDSASVTARLEIVVERVSPVAAESRANAREADGRAWTGGQPCRRRGRLSVEFTDTVSFDRAGGETCGTRGATW